MNTFPAESGLWDVRAVIFDMDGLMLDTERPDQEHFKRAAAEMGYPGLEPIYLQTLGRNWADTRKHFKEVLGDAFPYDEVRRLWREYSASHAQEFGVPVKPGLERLLKHLHEVGIPKAVATSTVRHDAVKLLDKVSLLRHFNTIVGGDEVSNGKPHPDIFLTAATRLNINPRQCVVFEDSPAGVRAAHSAGMIPILVPDVIPPDEETLTIAFRVLRTLEEAIAFFPAT